MSIITGNDGVLDDIFSYQVYNKIKNHWRGAAVPADIQAGMIWSDSDDDKLYHHGAADEEILQLTRSADVSPQFAHLGLVTAPNVDYGVYYLELLTDVDNSIKVGIYSALQVKKTAAVMTSSAYSLIGLCVLDSTNTQNWTISVGLRGVHGEISTEAGSAGTITGAANFFALTDIADAATITNLYGFYVATPTVAGSKVINEYGIYIADQNTGLTLNYAIYTNAGLVHFGGDVDAPNLSLGVGELTAGSINRGAGTLSLEIAGTSVIDILATYVNVKQNLFINETANANMTTGITIMGGNDEVIALKGSSVAHGMTDIAETDTWGTLSKAYDTAGSEGLLIVRGFTEAGTEALRLDGYVTLDNTNKTALAVAPVTINAAKKAAATVGAMGADGNLVVITNNLSTRFIFDEDGDMYYDGAAPANYDEFEDAVVCHDLAKHLCDLRNPAKEGFKNFIRYNRDALVKMGVVSDGGFVSTKSLNMLLLGAISQLGEKTLMLEDKLNLLEA